MKLRFKVNQAECFRAGIDQPKSLCHLDVDPATLPEDVRNLIADHLQGIDIVAGGLPYSVDEFATNVMADRPTLESLIQALREIEATKAKN